MVVQRRDGPRRPREIDDDDDEVDFDWTYSTISFVIVTELKVTVTSLAWYYNPIQCDMTSTGFLLCPHLKRHHIQIGRHPVNSKLKFRK